MLQVTNGLELTPVDFSGLLTIDSSSDTYVHPPSKSCIPSSLRLSQSTTTIYALPMHLPYRRNGKSFTCHCHLLALQQSLFDSLLYYTANTKQVILLGVICLTLLFNTFFFIYIATLNRNIKTGLTTIN